MEILHTVAISPNDIGECFKRLKAVMERKYVEEFKETMASLGKPIPGAGEFLGDLQKAFEKEHSEGFSEGKIAGYEEGREDGLEEGKKEGYNEGFDDAQEEAIDLIQKAMSSLENELNSMSRRR